MPPSAEDRLADIIETIHTTDAKIVWSIVTSDLPALRSFAKNRRRNINP